MTTNTKNTTIPNDKPIVLFDGVCNLCNGYIQWIIKRDPEGIFRFTSLQSEIGQDLLQKHQLDTKDLSTVVLIQNNKAYTHSNVALHMFKMLGGAWSLLYVFKIIPRPLRDAVYNIIARNRYKWFGEKTECMIPTPELQSRFL